MKTNYHTHTTWCDGANTPAEMAEAALAKNFDLLGFSSHSDMLKDPRAYIADIRALAEQYRGRLEILCGIEAEAGELPPGTERGDFDYVIGSVHYVTAPDGVRCPIDHTPELLKDAIREHFMGDVQAMILEYFAEERRMIQHGGIDIVGHPDLIRKFRSHGIAFSERSSWYQRELRQTADAIADARLVVEVNTGAISRGWLNDAYPSSLFRTLLTQRKVRYLLTSDAHQAETLDESFERFGRCEDFLPRL